MSAILDQIKQLAEQAAATGPDMTQVVKGGGGPKLFPEGYAMARLVEYVEFGQQPQEYNKAPKDPALEFQLGFAIWGDARDMEGNVVGQYHNADGTPNIIRTFPMAMSRNEKAKAYLLFKLMNWKGKHKHFAQLLSEAFLLKIENVKPKTDPNGKLRSNIDLKGFLPPLDAVSKQPYPVPQADEKMYRVFLWDYPTIEAWDSLHIEGNYDDGGSKNYIQEQILSALDFSGSALEALLIGSGKPFTRPAPTPKAAAPAAPNVGTASVQPAAPATESAPVVPAMPVVVMPAAPAAAPNVEGTTEAAAPAAELPSAPSMPSMPAMPTMPLAA